MRLHNLSGGLDSALALWLDLEAGREGLAVHHVRLADEFGREPHETVAVAAIRRWLEDRHGPLEYIESAVDLGGIPRPPFSDQIVVDTLTAMLLVGRTDIEEVVLASHLDAFPTYWRTSMKDAHKRRETILRTVAGRVPRWVRPLASMTKADIVSALPPGLAGLCWYCRKPLFGRPCGSCLTCRHAAGPVGDLPVDGCDR